MNDDAGFSRQKNNPPGEIHPDATFSLAADRFFKEKQA